MSLSKNRFSWLRLFLVVVGLSVLVCGSIATRNGIRIYRKFKLLSAAQAAHPDTVLNKCRALFDANWYLKTYPDVQGQDPFLHYMTAGWHQGKNPSPTFDGRFYHTAYQKSGFFKGPDNPLMHYVTTMQGRDIITHPSQIKKPVPLKNPKHKLALCTMFHNEARFLKEFIEYYLMMGVEHFYLYNDASTDDWQEVLQPYMKRGLITLETAKPEKKSLETHSEKQCGFFTRTVRKTAPHTEWLIVCDSDEFFVPLKHNSIPELLSVFTEAAQVSFNWLFFGTNNVDGCNETKLLTESLRSGSKTMDIHTKSIIRPRYAVGMSEAHHSYMRKGYLQLSDKKQWFVGPFCPDASAPQLGQINHYFHRDKTFIKNQIERKRIWYKNKPGWTEKDMHARDKAFSIHPNLAIQRFIPKLRKRMGLEKKKKLKNRRGPGKKLVF